MQMEKPLPAMQEKLDVVFREPTRDDGAAVFDLIERCKPLDTNSMYCNLLQCHHFKRTSVIALYDGDVVGFISGYRLPEQLDTLFVWQVAVDSRMRGQGLASRMLRSVLQRQGHAVRYLHTSITANNTASWNTFKRLALDLGAPLTTQVMFEREQHFDSRHDTESLVVIGPFTLFGQAEQ